MAFLRIPAQTSLAICSVQKEMAKLLLSQGVPDVSADSPVKGSSEEMVLINTDAELCDNFPGVQKQICAPNQNLPEITTSPTVTAQINGINEDRGYFSISFLSSTQTVEWNQADQVIYKYNSLSLSASSLPQLSAGIICSPCNQKYLGLVMDAGILII